MDCDICVVTKLKFQLDILSSPRVSKEERRLKIEIFFEADCSSWIEYTSREPGLRTIREKRKKIGEKAKQGKGGREEGKKEGRRSSAIMETRPLFGRFGTRNAPSKRKCRTIFTELRAERANSRSDVDTYVRFRRGAR